ncbi:MAG TPA: glycine oxidase ThiO [Candidatus Tectomicrobia bacterium]|nr:glycine oxidase ThiO [Candidatus Tectomicrobia bacterium]
MDSTKDVVIVGAGIVGCSIAWELAKAGLQVCLLERGGIGEESSAAAAGMLSGQHGVTNFGARYQLHLQARELHAALADELRQLTGIDVGFCRWGILELLFTAGEVRAADRCYALQTEAGLRVERLTREEALAREPAVSPDIQGAIRYVDEAHVHNGRLTIALGEAARRAGAEVRSGDPAITLLRQGERVVGVQTPHEVLHAGTVVVANGAWAAELVAALGIILPIKPMRGQMLAVRTVPRAVQQVIYGRHMYVVPRAEGETLIGATVEDVGFRKEVTLQGLEELVQAGRRVVPGIMSQPVIRTWAGLRPGSPDGLPLVGPVDGWAGLLLAVGHYRNGILLGPLTGVLVKQLLVDRVYSPHLDLLRPERFPLRSQAMGV